jgi:hypothetical protein
MKFSDILARFTSRQRNLIFAVGVVVLFILYTYGLTRNPPGFYIDESAFAYNAYLIARTGTSEFGVRWPLFFQNFTAPFTTYANPVAIYLLAAVNLVFPPSIWLSRFLSATAEFSAALLLGLLALRISRRRAIGVIVACMALVTPWLFEVGRLYFDSSFYPLVLALFLLALHSAAGRERWTWPDALKIGIALGLLTYTYTIGRLLAPLLAIGLVVFAVNRRRLIDLMKVWIIYGLTLIPLFVFNVRHPGLLTSRFMLISYVRKEPDLAAILSRFIFRYFQDLSLVGLLTAGDVNARHHVPDANGSVLIAPLLLSLLGIVIVISYRRRDSLWRFIIFATLVAVVPGALTVDAFHTGRMIAYEIFLLVLMVPALEWLYEIAGTNRAKGIEAAQLPTTDGGGLGSRQALLIGLLLATAMQAAYFQVIFWRDGPKRALALDAGYKAVYDVAVSMPSRPIYLEDGYYGPAYIHAFWYATLEGRSTSEFVHLEKGALPPSGALVISSENDCETCEVVFRSEQYMLYREF